jgi:hypothetical protein
MDESALTRVPRQGAPSSCVPFPDRVADPHDQEVADDQLEMVAPGADTPRLELFDQREHEFAWAGAVASLMLARSE